MGTFANLLLYTFVLTGLWLNHTAAESNVDSKQSHRFKIPDMLPAKDLRFQKPEEHLTSINQLDNLMRQAGVENPLFRVFRDIEGNPMGIWGYLREETRSADGRPRVNLTIGHAFHDNGVGLEWATFTNRREKESKTVVTGIRKTSFAEKAGFKVNDEILQIGEGPGLSIMKFFRQEQAPNPIPFIVRRGVERMRLTLPLPDITDLPLYLTDPPDVDPPYFQPKSSTEESI